MPAVGLSQTLSWQVRKVVGLSQTISFTVEGTEAVADETVVPSRCNPFSRVLVDHLVAGETRVSWEMAPEFIAPTPWFFRLQYNHAGFNRANDWMDVDVGHENVSTLSDAEQRVWGKQLTTYYRVLLTDDNGSEYISEPIAATGSLGVKDWLYAREILRKEQLRLEVSLGGVRGYLIKRRRDGAACTVCLDPYTDDVLDARCPSCHGTGFTGGYFRPLANIWAEIIDQPSREQRTLGPGHMAMEGNSQARLLGIPLLSSEDVFVDADSDLRYFVKGITASAQVRTFAVVQNVELHQAPFGDPIYRLPLPFPGKKDE